MRTKDSKWTQMSLNKPYEPKHAQMCLNKIKGAWMSLSSNKPKWTQMSLSKPNWV